MTATAAPPWLGLYSGLPTTIEPACVTALEMFRATLARAPDATIAYYFDTPIRASTIDAMSDALAVAFSDASVGVGDRVAMYLQNVPEAMVTLVAAWKCGAVVVPCNPMLRERELKKILVDSGSRILVCHEDLLDDVASTVLPATAVELVVTCSPTDMLSGDDTPAILRGLDRTSVEGATRMQDLVTTNAGRVPEDVELVGDDIALMVYTSGTTGAPKGATNTHANVVFATSVYERWIGIDDSDVILGIAPLFHVTGLVGHISLSLLTGAPLVLFYRFDAGEACRLAEKHGATFTVSAVTAFIALLHSDALDRHDLSRLTKVYTGGAPTPPGSLKDWRIRTGSRLNPMYGLTEATSPTHMTPPGVDPPVDPRTGVVSVGVPVFGTSVRIIGEDGLEADPGVIGELLISGPQVVPGYWQKPEETRESLSGGELRTGDVGFMDEHGWFYLVDRAKDMIVASGFKVWPREVEEVLYEHPAILEAAVVGVPDPYRGETVKAVVSLKPGATATPDEIKVYARERMAAYKYPRIVEIVDDLPKTTSGKILRKDLRSTVPEPVSALSVPDLSRVSYDRLRVALGARAVIELGVTGTVLGRGGIRAGRAAELYRRLEQMLAQVRADGQFIDREAFLDANDAYHHYLIGLADNSLLSNAFLHLQLRDLFGELLQESDATSEQVVLQHERLTDAVAADSADGAGEAIIAWAAAADRHVRLTLGEVRVGVDDSVPTFASVKDSMTPVKSPGARRAALAEALQARTVLEVGVLRLLGDEAPVDGDRLAASLLARSPLVRGDDRGRVEDHVRADDNYHRALIGALGNAAVLAIYDALELADLLTLTLGAIPPAVRDLLDDQHRLLNALRGDDYAGAAAAATDQNQRVRDVLLGASWVEAMPPASRSDVSAAL
jgi:long-chain acyl-CoA synthetase